jgi:hypothetical protein
VFIAWIGCVCSAATRGGDTMVFVIHTGAHSI